MIIASIDQSFTNTAICLLETETTELLDFFVIKTKNKIQNQEVPYERRMIQIMEYFFSFVEQYNVELVILEGLSLNRNTVMSRPLAGLYYYICIELYKRNIPYINIPPKTVKKFASKGDATKEDMLEALNEDIKNSFIKKGYKKSTGLMDLTDSYFIGLTYIDSLKK